MTFIIHRGTQEIGGSCVEICTDTTRLVIDMGLPLKNNDGSRFDDNSLKNKAVSELISGKILPNIPALYNEPDGKETAVLISHAHQDHYGLLHFVNAAIPVYIGTAAHKLIQITALFAGKEDWIKNPCYFKSEEVFTFGDIEITPYLVDHAAFDAYSFLVSAENKTLFYSGDFRAHGRKYKMFYRFLHNAPQNVDYLLLEGTTVSRDEQKPVFEAALESDFIKAFLESKGINLVYASGQNIDRLVTIYRAAKQCGKMLVVDIYTAHILENLAELGHGVMHPGSGFSDVKVFVPSKLGRNMDKQRKLEVLKQFKKYEISHQQISEQAKKIVMIVRPSMYKDIEDIQDIDGGSIVYSLWEGYKKEKYTEEFIASLVERGMHLINIHTSGHADTGTLKRLVEAMHPKNIIPIHTEAAEHYGDLFSDSNIILAQDGEHIDADKPHDADTNESDDACNNVDNLNLLNCFEKVGEKYKNAGSLSKEVSKNIRPHLDFIVEKLEITPEQAILYSAVIAGYNGYSIGIKPLARYIDCSLISLIQRTDDFEALESKNLLVINREKGRRSDGTTFEIPLEVLEDLRHGNPPEHLFKKELSIDEFIVKVKEVCYNRYNEHRNYDNSIKNLELLLNSNEHLNIVKKIKAYNFSVDDAFILLNFCYQLLLNDNSELSISGDLGDFFEDEMDFISAKRELQSGEHILQEKGLIENVNDGGFASSNELKLTEKAKDELLQDYTALLCPENVKGVKNPVDIAEKTLYYPANTQNKIDELTNLLLPENFASVQKNLAEQKMRTGFACLFTGGPGTGKTETALQIARKTGRAIMQVDIAESKSMWFGESEKRIKEIFTKYRSLAKKFKITPILLFNEADAIISKRQDLGKSKNGPGQTENAIQNIILQEIEILDGILIATTNLAQNMDKAFERRFLYKIEFENPEIETRKAIWKEMLSHLSDDEAGRLASQFTLSGGKIENIARRNTVRTILSGSAMDLNELIVVCKEEEEQNSTKRIGFV